MSKVVVILSGGLDSTVLAYSLQKQGHGLVLISFNYGQKHAKELSYAARTAAELKAPHYIIDMANIVGLISASALTNPDIEIPEGHYAADNMKATVVPNRNAIMISLATGLAVNVGADFVATGVHAGDHFIYPDCRPQFIDSISHAMYLANEGMSSLQLVGAVQAPLAHMTKSDIVKLGELADVPFENTWSCYKGGEKHCGRCGTCIERIEAFELAGVPDPTEYEENQNARI